MRKSLLYNPFDLIERAAIAVRSFRRRRLLSRTPGRKLGLGYLTTLELLELLRSSPPGVIYDIGANIGTWTCLAKSVFPSARVEAFEPLEMHGARFPDWTSTWTESVRLHRLALGTTEATVAMNVMDLPDASSLLALTELGARDFHTQGRTRVDVPLVPLDAYVERHSLAPPHLIKLDVQGYELEVLRGGERCLAHAQAVICEVSFQNFYHGQATYLDLMNYLHARGFSLHALGTDTALGIPLSQADALFVRNRG
jgi:FkbM family methyltransferase